MYARVNTIFGRKDMIDAGVSAVEESDRTAVEAIGGNRGLTTLVDRDGGVIVAVSYWDEPARSLQATLTRAREGAVTAVGGDLVVETYEVADVERIVEPGPGAVVRMVRLQIEPARIAEGRAFLHERVLPRLRIGTGYCAAELLIDRERGSGVFVTTWATEVDATRADSVLDELRDEARGRTGVRFPRTETYALVHSTARAD